MSRRKSSTKNQDDSSVVVQDSPVSSMKQKGNLTGNTRIMRDHVFEISMTIQAWNGELLEGMSAVAEIKAIMFRKLNSKKSEVMSYVSLLEEPCRTLGKICSKMEKIVEDIRQMCVKISAVCKLEERNENRKVLFLTWPASKFAGTAEQIYEIYKKELEMKIAIKEELCFCTDKDTLVFLEAVWLQEAYIDRYVSFYHEAMLKEVGHLPFQRDVGHAPFKRK